MPKQSSLAPKLQTWYCRCAMRWSTASLRQARYMPAIMFASALVQRLLDSFQRLRCLQAGVLAVYYGPWYHSGALPENPA